MAKRLVDNLTTNYLEAAQRLNSKHARHKIVAFVEGYDGSYTNVIGLPTERLEGLLNDMLS